MSDLEVDVPRVKSYIAGFAARGIVEDIISLADIAGNAYQVFYYVVFEL